MIKHNVLDSEDANSSKEHDLGIVEQVTEAICGEGSGVKVKSVFKES